MKVSARVYEFACHSKACAPPPAGAGGSLPGKGGGTAGSTTITRKVKYAALMNKHRTTSVTPDGKIAVSAYGKRLPQFRTRSSKSQAWLLDRKVTAISREKIANQ